jgi:hypothetical protein
LGVCSIAFVTSQYVPMMRALHLTSDTVQQKEYELLMTHPFLEAASNKKNTSDQKTQAKVRTNNNKTNDKKTNIARNESASLGHKKHTKTTQGNNTTTLTQDTPNVQFISPSNLTGTDIFAASWWQTISRFLESDKNRIGNVEGDAFVPIRRTKRGDRDVRMAVDWLDFSIEHLSKWWKLAGRKGEIYLMGKLQTYAQRASQRNVSSCMNTTCTLALIPYGVGSKNPQTKQMWKSALLATVSSLLQFGVARVVVVGYYDADAELAAAVFDQLVSFQQEHFAPIKPSSYFTATFGSTELAFVHTDNVNSTFTRRNVPKGAIVGLENAIKDHADQEKWLGKSPSKYKYIYFSESDQILNARLSSTFLDAMDDGGVVVPHRLQPIPHMHDLKGILDDNEMHKVLPGEDFNQVYQLDAEQSSCCDTNTHLLTKPECGGFWWQCGFGRNKRGNFKHLKDYGFMRLTDGTGIVSLASTEHSRRCHPIQHKRGCM